MDAEDNLAGAKRSGMLRSALLLLAGTLLPMALFFGVLEVIARTWEAWNPPMRVDLGQGFDDSSRLFVPSRSDHARMVTNPEKLECFRRESFAKIKPPRTMRVFILGGSVVNYSKYFFLETAEKLSEKLRSRFDDVEIVNCGGLSYASSRLTLVAREVLQYQPDLIVYHEAHNEFEEVQQMDLANLPSAHTQRLLSHSALYRFIRDRRAHHEIGLLEEDKRRRDFANSIPEGSKDWAHKFTPEEVSGRMDAYRQNLAKIVGLCREKDVPVILGTVPSNLVKPSLPGPEGERYEREVLPLFCTGQWEKGAALGREILKNASPRHQSSDLENGILRQLCREMNVPLADVEAAFIAHEPHHVPGETLFYDECHPSLEGYALMVFIYMNEMLRMFGGVPADSDTFVFPRSPELPCPKEP